jgi:hypothetical protein
MEDQVFNIDYLMQTEGCYYSSVPLYHYWQRTDSADTCRTAEADE